MRKRQGRVAGGAKGKDEGKPKNERREKIERTLGVKLSDAERMEMGGALAEQYIGRDQVEARRKEKMSEFKAELDAIDTLIGSMSQMLHSGERDESVACERVYDYDAGTVTEYRVDTGEVLETREMTDYDRQREIGEDSEEKSDAAE